MWRELSRFMKRYYEDNKKYVTRVFRNNDIKCEMSVVGVYADKKSTFMIVLYPLDDTPETVKKFGPTTIKFLIDDENTAKSFIDFVKKNLTEAPPNFNKLYNSEFSRYIVEEQNF